MIAKRLGFNDAVSDKLPDPVLAYDPYYIEGYRDGLISKIELARRDLESFDDQYRWSIAE